MQQRIACFILCIFLAGCGEKERPVQSTEQFRQSLQEIEKLQPHAGKVKKLN